MRMGDVIIDGTRPIALQIVYDAGRTARRKEKPRMGLLPTTVTWLPPVTARYNGGKNVTPMTR